MFTAKSLLYDYLKENVFDEYELRIYREDFLSKLKNKEQPTDIFDDRDNDRIKENLNNFLKDKFK
jgi:hypothetical protein